MASKKFIYEDLDAKCNENLLKLFITPFRTGYVKCKGCLMPEYFRDFGDRIREMHIRDDDVWVCTFPKTGTTWVQEMVWCIGNNLDFEAAKEYLPNRFPFLELTAILNRRKVTSDNSKINFNKYLQDTVTFVETLPSPRFIKTHLPFNLLPEKLQNESTTAKIIFVIRNPRDTCISYYHHCKLLEGYKGSFEQFAELFLEGNVIYGPFFNHTKGYWQQRNNANILVLKYEEMKNDLDSVVRKTANFMGKILNENDIKRLVDHLSFSNMKQNKAVNYQSLIETYEKFNLTEKGGSFMRRGQIGEWKEIMDSNLRERFEKWEEDNSKEVDIKFSI